MTALINAMAHMLAAILGDAVPLSRNATFTSTAFDTQDYEGQLAVLQTVGAAATGTLDGKITHCATSGGTYVDLPGATFTQVGDTGDNQVQKLVIDLNGCQRYIKYVGTIAASGVFTMGATVCGVKKYQ